MMWSLLKGLLFAVFGLLILVLAIAVGLLKILGFIGRVAWDGTRFQLEKQDRPRRRAERA